MSFGLLCIFMFEVNAKVIVIGPSGAGKSTFINAMLGECSEAKKTQMIEFKENYVDIPGEYIEIRRFNYIVIDMAIESSLIIVIQDATSDRPSLPAGFCAVFQKPVIGIINKIDLKEANIDRAEKFLIEAGVIKGNIFAVSSKTHEGIAEVKRMIHKMIRPMGQ
ncbi:MAG: ethanolamine utilization protein EutP [Thermosediminibacterales bacterium]|nr:ethanolamine utilization protein EutP [Thermoanaerobacter sp.]MDK2836453.1 ethanolamine utilization protein EutP [Thermosediminibacterales bacterium]